MSLFTWEAVATVMVAQTHGGGMQPCSIETDEAWQIVSLLGVPKSQLNYVAAAEQVDNSQEFYGSVLSRVSGYSPDLRRLAVPLNVANAGNIVVCPFGLKPEVGIRDNLWRDLIRHLRTYDLPLICMGDRGQRMNLQFAEHEIVSELSVLEKLQILAGAQVIVGVANAWTWLSTAWDKKMVMLYPDTLPMTRWFPWSHENVYWLTFARDLPTPIVLTGLRDRMGVV